MLDPFKENSELRWKYEQTTQKPPTSICKIVEKKIIHSGFVYLFMISCSVLCDKTA